MKDIIRTFNPTVRFSNFTLNIKIYDKFEKCLEREFIPKILDRKKV